jgi:hypothetical protein
MNANDPNVVLLEVVAERLGDDLRDEMVFVGGAVAGLLITDPAMPAIRPTEDVDLLCQAVVLADYHRVEKALRTRGFVQDMRPQAPICRWQIASVVDDERSGRQSVGRVCAVYRLTGCSSRIGVASAGEL